MPLSSFRALLLKSAFICLMCGCAAQDASAFKLAYTVGSDGQCDYHDLNSAVQAVKQNPNPNRIFVAVNVAAPTSNIVVNNANLSIQGGFANCSDFDEPSGRTTINGSGNGGHSVFSITGNSDVTLYNLLITGGNAVGNDGGGIYFSGTGSLTLSATTVQVNHATNGGGIEMDADGGAASLILGSSVFVSGNVASGDGGGIRLTGSSTLTMTEDVTQIANNHADSGTGGGVLVVGPAAAYLGSPGIGSAGAIYGNTAQNGGGAAVLASDGSNGVLYLFTIDATRPGRISNNAAFNRGGGIYLKSYSPTFGDDTYATLCAFGYRIDTNTAVEGTAIFGDYDTSVAGDSPSLIYLSNQKTGFDPNCPTMTFDTNGAKECTATTCNLVDTNQANDIGNSNAPTDGAAIYLNDSQGYDEAFLTGVKIQNNTGGYAIRGSGSLLMSASLIAENHVQHELLRLQDEGLAYILGCTMANDEINSQYAVHSENSIILRDSIFDEAGTKSLDSSGESEIDNILSNDISTLPSDPSIIMGDPMFFDLPNGDYRLRATKSGATITASPAIDFAPPVSGDDRDVEGRPYDQDISIPNRAAGSVRDLGAYEMQPITDRIFADAFGDPITIVY